MATESVVLSLNADELAVLPERPSLAELLSGEGSCRTQLLPEIKGDAGAMGNGIIGSAAGTWRPDSWHLASHVRLQAVNLFKMRGAYYFPEYGVLVDRAGRVMRSSMAEAAYVTPDLLRLPHMHKSDDRITFAPPTQVDVLSNAIITMPWGGLHNYGHFLLDCLPAVASLLDVPALRDGNFVFPALKPWHRDHLRLLGISPTELPRKLYYVETALFTNCMDHFLRAPNKNYLLVPRRQLAALGREAGGKRKIYLSRRGNKKRAFVSESELESALQTRGFEIVQTETMSVADQIALFASAAVVVGCTGAAFANALYCPPGAVVVEVQPRTMQNVWVRNICVLGGLTWAPYFCDSQPPAKPVIYGGKERPDVGISFDVDHADFLAYVDQVAGERQD